MTFPVATVQTFGVSEVNTLRELTAVAELVTLSVVDPAVGVTDVLLFAGEASRKVKD